MRLFALSFSQYFGSGQQGVGRLPAFFIKAYPINAETFRLIKGRVKVLITLLRLRQTKLDNIDHI